MAVIAAELGLERARRSHLGLPLPISMEQTGGCTRGEGDEQGFAQHVVLPKEWMSAEA